MIGFTVLKARRFARGVTVFVAVVLLCLGVVLSLPVSGSEGPSTLGLANVLHVDQGANGNAPPLDGTYLFFAPAKEAKETDKHPLNAGLLTMLFLAASFFGASAGRALANVQGQGALCFSSLGVIGEVLGSSRGDYLPFLGVFRL